MQIKFIVNTKYNKTVTLTALLAMYIFCMKNTTLAGAVIHGHELKCLTVNIATGLLPISLMMKN